MDRCLERNQNQYRYKVCFFKDANQNHTQLGRFEELVMKNDKIVGASFRNGQFCPGGPARSLDVKFVCGIDEQIMRVDEPLRTRCTIEPNSFLKLNLTANLICDSPLKEGQKRDIKCT